jgi:hypothetical protein
MKTIKGRWMKLLLALSLALVVAIPASVWADGTETLGAPSIAVASGTSILGAGVGLEDGQPADLSIDIPTGATIEQVILYWGGNNLSSGDQTPADTIQVGGNDVTGTFIGGNTQYSGNEFTVSYRADITAMGLVSAGTSTFSVGGLDFTEEQYGAGVLVIYDDGAKASQVDVRDGNDFAFINRTAPLNVTELQEFNFAPQNKDRIGSVVLFVGSVADDTGNYGFRPSAFEVTIDGNTDVWPDQLNSIDGRFWDTVNLVFTVPAGVDSLSTQIFSRDDEFRAPGNLPASLVWLASGFTVETPPAGDCWITTGGFHNAGVTAGSKDYTFGGNVGGPPRGSWEVVNHNNGDNFHSNDVHITSCEIIHLTGPDQPGGNKGFKINRANFAGTGRLNGVDGYPFTGFVNDAGEPQGKKANDKDSFSITVLAPNTSSVVFEASATMDGGNVQIHPPNGSGK